MQLNYTQLPAELCQLMRSSMQTSSRGYQLLKKSIWTTPSFQSVLRYACFDMKAPLSFERIINSLGWLGLRDRLAAIYIYHAQFGQFPHSIDLKNIEDILDFEQRVSQYTIDGHSRSFLLGFYAKLSMEKSDEGTKVDLDNDQLFEILAQTKTRVIAIDWLILTILNALQFLDKNKVLEALNEDDPFNAIKRNLNANQNYQMSKNLLTYAASINEDDIFVERI